MTPDTQHLVELYSLYNPTHPISPPNTSLQTTTPNPSTPAPNHILPYKCCKTTFDDFSQALRHFFIHHFHTIRTRKHGLASVASDIGNTTIHPIERASVFMKFFKTLPQNPRQFRPAPHSKPPLDFRNPYSSAMAMAYDFMETIIHQPSQYTAFLNKLTTYIPFTSHNDTWPYWAYFIYPQLLPPIPEYIASTDPKPVFARRSTSRAPPSIYRFTPKRQTSNPPRQIQSHQKQYLLLPNQGMFKVLPKPPHPSPPHLH
ncbi:hypothetical protein DSO57_1000466 [Entomophthora muscae]|uniref:Uncharacterized protein n=1 Tax=Entomophthora muscae TaxID=34485 RepID=A0ACC2UV99_9FUNG|nr:hypothetical protein DSO57_1000466 [Entomophthora muscae]